MAYKMPNVEIKDKPLLTVGEASSYFGIGVQKLNELISSPDCSFVLHNGGKKLIKKEIFNEFLMSAKSI